MVNMNVKRKKNGFTLIELLAVIVVLAIILVIAIPSVISSIDNAKIKQLKNAANAVEKWFVKQYDITKLGVLGNTSTAYNEFIQNNELNSSLLDETGISDANNDVDINLSSIQINNGNVCVRLKAKEDGKLYVAGSKNFGLSSGCKGPAFISSQFSKNYTVDINNINYVYDTEHNLMQDIGDNIRYYGESPNNYIYFNCTDYSNQSSSTCEVWRIIGIIDGKVKLIKGSNIGLYPYNEEQSGDARDFSESSISNYLNNTYYNNSITASTRTLISPTVYSYGRINNWNYPHEYYTDERSTDSGQFNIALTDPSDYGYAQDLTLNNAIFDMADWNDGSAYGNWLENVITDGNGGDAWLLNACSNMQDKALAVNVDGGVFTSPMTTYGYLTRHYVTPVLYLNTNLKVQSGNGTSANPYKLYVE